MVEQILHAHNMQLVRPNKHGMYLSALVVVQALPQGPTPSLAEY
jgi:hypothetical protein